MVKTKAKTILVVEDNAATRMVVRRLLSMQGYSVLEAASGLQGLSSALASLPALIITDWVLGPGMQGIDLCKRLKEDPATRAIPIIVFTGAKVQFQDELAALSHGADLYLDKAMVLGGPERWERLMGYVRALARRPHGAERGRPAAVRAESLHVDPRSHAVRRGDRVITGLSTTQFDLLYLLAKKHPQTLSRAYIVRALWRGRVHDREVDVMVSRLKVLVEAELGLHVETVFGKGYSLHFLPLPSATA